MHWSQYRLSELLAFASLQHYRVEDCRSSHLHFAFEMAGVWQTKRVADSPYSILLYMGFRDLFRKDAVI